MQVMKMGMEEWTREYREIEDCKILDGYLTWPVSRSSKRAHSHLTSVLRHWLAGIKEAKNQTKK
jgi:hypothetical protein